MTTAESHSLETNQQCVLDLRVYEHGVAHAGMYMSWYVLM